METEAYFANIRSQIQSELKSAPVSIHVAVAKSIHSFRTCVWRSTERAF